MTEGARATLAKAHPAAYPPLIEAVFGAIEERIVLAATIDGDPGTKARPRFDGTRTYTPRRTRDAEEAIGWAIKAAAPGLMPCTNYELGVAVVFETKTRQRRDIDNVVKLLFDACNGIVWADDAQVIEMKARVERGTGTGSTSLVVYTIGEPIRANCPVCDTPIKGRPSVAGKQVYCSKPCYDVAQRKGAVAPKCETCGIAIDRSPSRARRYKRNFCSFACRNASFHTVSA